MGFNSSHFYRNIQQYNNQPHAKRQRKILIFYMNVLRNYCTEYMTIAFKYLYTMQYLIKK